MPGTRSGQRMLECTVWALAALLAVAAAASGSGPDGGTISGQLTDLQTGDPLISGAVTIYDDEGAWVGNELIDGTGAYSFDGLDAGTYFAIAEAIGYVDERHEDTPCESFCNPLLGTPIVLPGAEAAARRRRETVDFALVAAGTISGTVTDEATGAPIPDLLVRIYDGDGFNVSFRRTDAAGAYTSDELAPGSYFVATDADTLYLDEVYDDRPCIPTCEPLAGTPVTVTSRSDTPGIDFALAIGGTIAGTVTDLDSGAPIDATVTVYRADGARHTTATTDENGQFATALGLAPGTYYARTDNFSGYLNALFDETLCPPPACEIVFGTPITVELGEVTGDVDFRLRPGGRISGTVLDAVSGEPNGDAAVSVYDRFLRRLDRTVPAADGSYVTGPGLEPGDYIVWTSDRFASAPDFVAELYDDRPCPALACDLGTGTLVRVERGETTTGIDVEVAEGGSVSGTLTTTSGEPLAGAEIRIRDSAGTSVSGGTTDEFGRYQTEAELPSGEYFSLGSAWSWDGHIGYLTQLFDGVECTYSECDLAAGDPVSVVVGRDSPNVDFQLRRGGTLSGRVTATDGSIVSNAVISIYDAAGQLAGQAVSIGGDYTSIEGLPAGSYFVRTVDPDGLADQLFDGLPCPADCDVTAGTPVVVVVDEDTGGIDFTLEPGAAPLNDRCQDALTIGAGRHLGTTRFATNDGAASCGISALSPDVWYRYVADRDVALSVDTCDALTDFDTVLSLHRDCDGPQPSDSRCDDDDLSCETFDFAPRTSATSLDLAAGDEVLIRVSGRSLRRGTFALNVDDGTARPTLAVSGSCPGTVTVEVSGVSPSGRVALVASRDLGSGIVPAGACAGTELALLEPRLLGTPNADADGDVSVTRTLNGASCGLHLQAIDLTSCQTSDTAPVPDS